MTTWDTATPLPANVGTTAAQVVDSAGRLYIIGGNGGAGALSTVYRYDATADTWTTLAALPVARQVTAGAFDSSGRLWLFGNDARVDRYDPGTDTWTQQPDSPVALAGSGRPAQSGVRADHMGRIYLVGDYSTQAQTPLYRLDPDTGTYTQLADVPDAYQYGGLFFRDPDGSGAMLLLGGQPAGGGALPGMRARRYDPTTNQWGYLTQLPWDGLLDDPSSVAEDGLGRVYLIARGYSLGASDVVSRYARSADTWSDVTPSLPTGLDQPYAAGLGDGRLYVFTSDGTAAWSAMFNEAPTAPVTTSPPDGASLNRDTAQRFAWTHTDPDAGDYQTAYDLRYRVSGSSTWTTVSAASPNGYYDVAAGTFADATTYEWQVRTYDWQGVAGPYCTSRFFDAETQPGVPIITAPTSGGLIAGDTTVEWSTADQDAYQVRRVADDAGAPDTAIVYYDTGEVANGAARSHVLSFSVNDRYEHVQVRVFAAGLWSAWASVRVYVSYTPPAAPTVTLDADSGLGSIWVNINNPAASGGEPAVSHNSVEVDDGEGWERRADLLTPSTRWRYWTPVSGLDYVGRVRVTAHGVNGIPASTTACPCSRTRLT